MRILLTGGTGLIGSHLAERLAAENEVVCVIRDIHPRSRFFLENLDKRTVLALGDVTDPQFLIRVLREYDVQLVYHLAAQAIVGVAHKSPASTFETNIKGTWEILDACRLAGVEKVVVASSDKAYGNPVYLPYDEKHPLSGRYPYDVSKSCADLISQCYFHSFGLNVVVARCANFYGPGDLNFSRIIPGTIMSILKGEAPIIRSDGSYERDYLYVSDAVSAYVAASRGRPGEAYNFGNETRVSVLNLVNQIAEIMGSDLKPCILGTASSEIERQSLSSVKAQRELGWSPRVSLREGLTGTVEWYVKHFEKLKQLT